MFLHNPVLYIDPGTGSMLFTVLIGVIGAAVYSLRMLWIKLRFVLSGGKAEKQYISASDSFVLNAQDARDFGATQWFSVSENIYDPACWQFIPEETVHPGK